MPCTFHARPATSFAQHEPHARPHLRRRSPPAPPRRGDRLLQPLHARAAAAGARSARVRGVAAPAGRGRFDVGLGGRPRPVARVHPLRPGGRGRRGPRGESRRGGHGPRRGRPARVRGRGALPAVRVGAGRSAHRGGAGAGGPLRRLVRLRSGLRPASPPRRRGAALRPRARAGARVLLPDPPGLRGDLPRDPGDLRAGRPAPRGLLGVGVHPRPPRLVRRRGPPHGRLPHAGHRTLGHRQGAGRPGDRRQRAPRLRPRGRSLRAGHADGRRQPRCAHRDAHRERAFRPHPRGLHRRHRRPRRLARRLPARRLRLPRRDRRARPARAGEAAPRAAGAHLHPRGRDGRAPLHRQARRRDAPRPAGRGGGRPVPPRPLLPPVRRRGPHALARRGARRPARRPGRLRPLPRGPSPRRGRTRRRPPGRRRPRLGGRPARPRPPLAGQRARARAVRPRRAAAGSRGRSRGNRRRSAGSPTLDALAAGGATAAEVQALYAAGVRRLVGSDAEAGRRLGLDRRTVRRLLSPDGEA